MTFNTQHLSRNIVECSTILTFSWVFISDWLIHSTLSQALWPYQSRKQRLQSTVKQCIFKGGTTKVFRPHIFCSLELLRIGHQKMFPFNYSSPAYRNKLCNYINNKVFGIGKDTVATAPNNIPRQRVCVRNGFGTTKPRMLTEGQRLLLISRSTFVLQQISFSFVLTPFLPPLCIFQGEGRQN